VGVSILTTDEMKTPSVPALERGLRILELIASSKTGLTFSQIANSLQVPKSSIHSLLLTFERNGYLHRSETTAKYSCSTKVAHIAEAASESLLVIERAGSVLRKLADSVGFTVHMGVWERNEVALVAKVNPFSSHRVATWVGKRIDFHCTSLGKCLLAYQPESEVDRLVRECGLLRHNENTICTITRLKQELSKVRSLGYALDDEEEEIGIRCIGVPVVASDEAVSSAISISGSVDQIDETTVPRLSLRLKEAASALAQRSVNFRI
jgi:DNA-binding IclR family transcriptional regulator